MNTPLHTPCSQDAIANKVIYRPSAVYPLGKGALLNNTVDPTFAPIQRPSLAQTFIDLSNGEPAA